MEIIHTMMVVLVFSRDFKLIPIHFIHGSITKLKCMYL